jgi:hypothetical protein
VSGGARYVNLLLQFIQKPDVVDDASALLIAYRLVELRTSKVLKERKAICATAQMMLRHNRREVWAYSGLWILSKYGTQRQVMNAIDETYPVWQSDYHLGRLVAALESMISVSSRGHYFGLLRASRNVGASEVSAFYDDILTEPKATRGILRFLRANNKNPNRISHSKWLVRLYVLNSPVVPAATKVMLKNAHSMALSDRYYRIRARRALRP